MLPKIHVKITCFKKKCRPILYSKWLYNIGQDFGLIFITRFQLVITVKCTADIKGVGIKRVSIWLPFFRKLRLKGSSTVIAQ